MPPVNACVRLFRGAPALAGAAETLDLLSEISRGPRRARPPGLCTDPLVSIREETGSQVTSFHNLHVRNASSKQVATQPKSKLKL